MIDAYQIFVETLTGDIVKAFTWMRDKQSGIAKGKQEARERNIGVARVWAEPIKMPVVK